MFQLSLRLATLSILLGLVLTAVACGGDGKPAAALTGTRDADELPAETGSLNALSPSRDIYAVAAPSPTPAPMLAVPAALPRVPALRPALRSVTASFSAEEKHPEQLRPPVVQPQQRMIVRTVDIALVVEDLEAALDQVSDMAKEMGGWVVHSSRREVHRGFISMRVPAGKADEAVDLLKALATEVESEVSASQDVTDEYVDNQARLRNLGSTEKHLLKLMERTAKVQELLEVQRELTHIQGEMERLQGRIKLLEDTSAFSLINVDLKLSPGNIAVDAGLDRSESEAEPARFRATFTPPEGTTDFWYEWDFGDGSDVIMGNRTTPGVDGSSRSTATVTHIYRDRKDSPFIVTFKITGTGEAGMSEGEDTLIVSVTAVPRLEVFAGSRQTAKEGDTVDFHGSFTRPEGMEELTFRWDFGDGSEPMEGNLGLGDTVAIASHTYPNHRPQPYVATLTVSGEAATGMVDGTDTLEVAVIAASPWDAGEVAGRATGALDSAGKGLALGGIWVGVFSPFWGSGLLLLAAYAFWRRRRISAP